MIRSNFRKYFLKIVPVTYASSFKLQQWLFNLYWRNFTTQDDATVQKWKKTTKRLALLIWQVTNFAPPNHIVYPSAWRNDEKYMKKVRKRTWLWTQNVENQSKRQKIFFSYTLTTLPFHCLKIQILSLLFTTQFILEFRSSNIKKKRFQQWPHLIFRMYCLVLKLSDLRSKTF